MKSNIIYNGVNYGQNPENEPLKYIANKNYLIIFRFFPNVIRKLAI